MVNLGRFGLLSMVVLVGCSESDERWGGQITETDGVLRVQNPSVPLAGPGAITARPLWRSSGPLDTDYWEAPNWVHADDEFVYVVDRQASKVHRLSLEGKPRSPLGEPGEGPGQYRRLVDAVPTEAGLFVVDGGNGRVEVLSPDGEIQASTLLGQVVFSVVPLGGDAIAVSGVTGREPAWQRIQADGTREAMEFPEFIDPDTGEPAPSRASTWANRPVRLRFTSPQIQIFSPTGELEKVIDLPLPEVEATDEEVEALVSEMARTLAEDGLPSGVIQQQADYLRTRSRAKFRFRDLRFDPSSELLTIWEQNPEDFGSGNASLHVLSLEGIYLGVLEFDLGWSAFDLKRGVLYALSRNPVTDLVTLQAYSISVPEDVLERAHDLYSGVPG